MPLTTSPFIIPKLLTLSAANFLLPECPEKPLTQLNSELADDPDEGETFRHLAKLAGQVPIIGREIIQSHQQTLTQLETLEAVEHGVEAAFERAAEITEAEIARHLQAGDLDEIREDSIPTRQHLTEFFNSLQILQVETLEFVALGEAEALEDRKRKPN